LAALHSRIVTSHQHQFLDTTNMLTFLRRFALVASLTLPTVTAIPTISVKGAKFFADGQQFFIKGAQHVEELSF
jgi:hypothetical protein